MFLPKSRAGVKLEWEEDESVGFGEVLPPQIQGGGNAADEPQRAETLIIEFMGEGAWMLVG